MKPKSNRTGFALKLSHQVILMVAIVLTMELVFLGLLWKMLQQSEQEASKAIKAKEVLGNVQRMLRLTYEGGNAIEQFTQSARPEDRELYLSNMKQVKDILTSLKTEVVQDPEPAKLVHNIDSNIDRAGPLVAEVIRAVESSPSPTASDNSSNSLSQNSQSSNSQSSNSQSSNSQSSNSLSSNSLSSNSLSSNSLPGNSQSSNSRSAKAQAESAQEYINQRKQELHKIELALLPDLVALTKVEREIEAQSPAAERQARENIKSLIVAALPANILLAFALAVYFNRGVTSRLEVVVDNTERMSNRQRLHTPLTGHDEIGRLDSVFHQMAETLRRDEEALKASEESVRSIIEFMPIGLVELDESGRIQFLNSRTEALFGYTADDLIGAPFQRLIALSSDSSAQETIKDLLSKSLNRVIETTGARKDKSLFPIELTLSNFPGPNKGSQLAIILDVTERTEMQRLRQAFVAMVSHELRTPLTSISAFLHLINIGAYGELAPKHKEAAVMAERNTSRLMSLINDLLDLEKLESGGISVTLADAPIADVFEQSLASVDEFARQHQVTLQLPKLDWTLQIDSQRIVQVLVNLLSNAIKFSPPGETVRVEASKDDHWALFQVIDRGRGFPEKYRDAIFERFQQVSASDSREKGGTGLGLPICKAIVEQHDGHIGVETTEGKGSTFWFKLPV